MTNRERIVSALCCKPTDRPPVMDWLGLLPWPQTLERWRTESGIADLDVASYFGYDHGFLIAPLELGPFPHFDHRVIERTTECQVYRDWRGITIRNRNDGNTLPEYIANPVSTPSDWEHYKRERMQPRLIERTEQLKDFSGQAERLDAPVQVGVYPYGLFGTLRDILGVAPLLFAYYDEPEMVRDIIKTHVDLWLQLYGAATDCLAVDHIHIWEDMSGKHGSLISMDMVEMFMMPFYEEISAFAKTKSVPIISVDSDGYVSELVEVMTRHGVSSFFPFEVQAGNDAIEYRKQYPHLSVWGGLDKRALAWGRDAMHVELDRATELFGLGGYIAGFDHLIPPDVPWENFKYFVMHLKSIAGL